MCVAQFVRFYGHEAFNMGALSYRWFWFLYVHIPKITQQEQVVHSTAVAMGAGLAMNGKEAAPMLERFRIDAFTPEY